MLDSDSSGQSLDRLVPTFRKPIIALERLALQNTVCSPPLPVVIVDVMGVSHEGTASSAGTVAYHVPFCSL